MRARLLGGFALHTDAGVVTRFRTAKTRELVAYLCYFRGRAHAREELAERFWPEAEPEAGRQSLRMALSDIRKEAGADFLLAHRTSVQLGSTVETDTERLAQALLGKGDLPDVEGPLLPGFFADWIPVEHAHLANSVREAWRTARQEGDRDREVALAQIGERLDPEWTPEPRRNAGALPPGTSFVGRERELASLRNRFGRSRLVTLLGIGGAGKTRLALEYAAGVEEDVVVVDWSARTAGEFWRALAEALGLLGMVVHTRRQVLEYLRDRPVLLVLDNLETILPEAAEAMAELVRRTHEPTILVTSRVAVRIPEESCLLLGPIDVEDAERLFRDRARQASPETELDDATVARLCAEAGHLPLALEVIASQLEAVPVATLLATARVTVNESTASAVESAWRRLVPRDQGHLVSLAVLPSDFDYPAASATAALESPDAMRRLLRSGLLTRRDDRYAVLEPVRDQIRDRLPDVQTEAQERLCEEAFRWALEIESHYFQPGEPDAIRLAEYRGPLFRQAAATWSARREPRTAKLVRTLAWAWCMLGETVVGDKLARDSVMPGQEGLALFTRSILNVFGGRPGVGFATGMQALQTDQVLGDVQLLGHVEQNVAIAAAEIGEFETAHRLIAASLLHHRDVPDQRFVGGVYNVQGLIFLREGRPEAALPWFEDAYRFYLGTGYRWGQASVLNELAAVRLHAGDAAASLRLQEECLAIKQSLGDRRGIALCHVDLAPAALRLGNRERARRSLREAVTRFGELGDDWGLARTARVMADLVDDPGGRHALESVLSTLQHRIQDSAEPTGGEVPSARLARLL